MINRMLSYRIAKIEFKQPFDLWKQFIYEIYKLPKLNSSEIDLINCFYYLGSWDAPYVPRKQPSLSERRNKGIGTLFTLFSSSKYFCVCVLGEYTHYVVILPKK